jgi:hypothetical protein
LALEGLLRNRSVAKRLYRLGKLACKDHLQEQPGKARQVDRISRILRQNRTTVPYLPEIVRLQTGGGKVG